MGVEQHVAEEVRRCRCGHDKRHPWVRPEKHYTPWGQLAFSILFTPLPKRIDLRCGICREVVGSITDPEDLQKFRYREPRPEER
jgi:hypothetical protein